MADPPAVLRDQLAAARTAGLDFDDAWPTAVDEAAARARWASDRYDWWQVFEATRDAWHAAYVGRPAERLERAISAVAYDPERSYSPSGLWCPNCGDPLPEDAHPNARYCSHACQRAIHRRAPIAA